jgi:hypothetical protein
MSEPIDLYAIAERLEEEAYEAWRQSFRIDTWTVPKEFDVLEEARRVVWVLQDLIADIRDRMPTAMEVRAQMLRDRYGYYEEVGE